MTTLEFKNKMAAAILTETNEERLNELKKVFIKLYNKTISEPCVFTDEELRESVARFEKDIAEGKIEGIPHEKMKKKYAL